MYIIISGLKALCHKYEEFDVPQDAETETGQKLKVISLKDLTK
jgi:hypothetical protein